MLLIRVAAALLAQAAPAAAAPSVDAASEAEVRAFIAALPDSETLGSPKPEDEATANSRVEQERLHPAHIADVRRLFADLTKCRSEAQNGSVLRFLRASALALTSAQRQSMTSFYRGPDYRRFVDLTEAGDESKFTAAQKATYDEIMARYPIAQYNAVAQRLGNDIDQFAPMIAAMERCDQVKGASLAAIPR